MAPLSSAVLKLHTDLPKGAHFLSLAVAACRQGWGHLHSGPAGMTVLQASSDAAGAKGMWPLLSLDVEYVEQTVGAWGANLICPVKYPTPGKICSRWRSYTCCDSQHIM